jgi:hypothetical protein
MKKEGPILEVLLRRISEIPEDFLAEPRIGTAGVVHVDAVVNDFFDLIGLRLPQKLADGLGSDARAEDRNRLALVLVLAWLLADRCLIDCKPTISELASIFDDTARELSATISSRKFIADVDRREELARIVLARLGRRPAGETPEAAQDRLTSLSSTERARILKASRAAEERARKIREQLASKAAEESADKWTRE